jgi:hypothetical protein
VRLYTPRLVWSACIARLEVGIRSRRRKKKEEWAVHAYIFLAKVGDKVYKGHRIAVSYCTVHPLTRLIQYRHISKNSPRPNSALLYNPSTMLSTLVSFLTLAALATASPLAERQSGVQVIRNCNVQGQVALTFDGMSFSHPLLSYLWR